MIRGYVILILTLAATFLTPFAVASSNKDDDHFQKFLQVVNQTDIYRRNGAVLAYFFGSQSIITPFQLKILLNILEATQVLMEEKTYAARTPRRPIVHSHDAQNAILETYCIRHRKTLTEQNVEVLISHLSPHQDTADIVRRMKLSWASW